MTTKYMTLCNLQSEPRSEFSEVRLFRASAGDHLDSRSPHSLPIRIELFTGDRHAPTK